MRPLLAFLVLSNIGLLAQPGGGSPPDPRWRTVGSGTLAQRPSSCTSPRSVYICLGTGCNSGFEVDYCIATNTWASIGNGGGGSMIYPGAGIPNSTGSAWAASYSTSGSGTVVALTNSPSFTTPTLGAATATSINKLTITAPASSSTLTIANGKTLTVNNSIGFSGTDSTTMTFPSSSATIAGLGIAQTFTAANIFGGGTWFSGGVDAQSGTSYTVVSSDENKLLTFNNSSAVAATLPQATTAGFTVGAIFHLYNIGAGTVTVTPTTSTINGSATLALAQGQGAYIVSDGTNYSAWVSSTGGGGSGTVTTFSAGNLSPLFTTSVATATTTPALTFTLSNAAQNSVLAGPASGGAGAPSYQTAPTISAANMTSFPTLNQNTTGNAATATNLASYPALCTSGQFSQGLSSGSNNCGTPSGGGNTTSTSLTTNTIPKANGANSIINSSVSDNGTTVSTTEALSALSITTSGSAAGTVSMTNNSTPGTVVANSWGWTAPGTITTAWYGEAPNASPAANQIMLFPAPTSNVSQWAWTNFNLTGMGATFSSPLSLSTNTVTCSTCVTSASALTNNAPMIGGGSQASSTISVVNNAVLVTNGSGVPSESTTLPSGLSATNLTLTTPALGTPSSGTLTNATGLPLTSGVTGVLPSSNGGTGVNNTATLTLGTSNQNWATLGTGIVKNTTTTGAISNAAAADVYGLWSGTCSSSTFLRGDGACAAPAGGGSAAVRTSVTSSTTPTFTCTSNTADTFAMTLTAGSVTSSTLTGCSTGERVTFEFTQPSGGGNTLVYPTNVTGACTIDPAANITTSQTFVYDGTNAAAITGCTNTETSFVMSQLPERTDPSNPLSGNHTFFASSTNHQLQDLDNSGNRNSMVRTGSSATSNQWVDYIAVTGIPHTSQPALSNLTATFSAPLSLSSNTLSITGAAGQVLAGSTPAFTATPTLGTDNSVAGTMQLANSAANAHTIWSSGATTSNTIAGFATAPTTGDLVTCTTASTTCTLTDGGFLATNIVRKDANNTMAAVTTFPGGDLFSGGVDAQSGTSYTVVSGDENKLLTFNNGSAVAVTLPQATTAGFTSGAFFHVFNRGAGAVTITPTTSTINGSATAVLNQNQGAYIVSDGTNYSAWVSSAPSGSGTVTSVSFTGGLISVATATTTPALTVAGTSGGIPYFSSSSAWASSGALTAGGLVYGGGAGASPGSSSAGTSKQIALSGGSGSPTWIDFPDVHMIPAANCNNATAGAGWSIGSGGTVTCRAGTNDLGGFIAITDTSSTFATFQIQIPEDWDSGSNPYIRFQLASTDTTSGHTIIPSIQVACYKGDGSTTDDVAANAAHSLSTVTLNTTANQMWSSANVQMNSTDVTGCVAGALMQITVGRATDTATNARFYGATITFPRLLVVQAN